MSIDPRLRGDRPSTSAEKLLREAGINGLPEQETLTVLLTAVTVPARANELSGERAALAAFRKARSTAGDAAPAVPMAVARSASRISQLTRVLLPRLSARGDGDGRKTPAGRTLRRPLRAATFGFLAIAVGGVTAAAVAAGTAHLPSMLGSGDAGQATQRTDKATSSPLLPPDGQSSQAERHRDRDHEPPPTNSSPKKDHEEHGKEKDTPRNRGSKPSSGARDTSPRSLRSPFNKHPSTGHGRERVGSCRRYATGKSLTKREFDQLSTAAGGKHKVRAYCARVVKQGSEQPHSRGGQERSAGRGKPSGGKGGHNHEQRERERRERASEDDSASKKQRLWPPRRERPSAAGRRSEQTTSGLAEPQAELPPRESSGKDRRHPEGRPARRHGVPMLLGDKPPMDGFRLGRVRTVTPQLPSSQGTRFGTDRASEHRARIGLPFPLGHH